MRGDVNKEENITEMEHKESKKTFGQMVKAVVAFPFKVLWFVVKVAGVMLLAGVLTTVGYCVYRSGQPMIIPEARGMTYRQLFKDRYESWKALDERNTAAGKDKSGHACTLSGVGYESMFVVPMLSSQMTISAFYPESKFARNVEGGDSYFYRNLPVGSEAKLRNFLPLFWEAVERQSWTWWVLRTTYSCPSQPVKFPESTSP